MDHVDKDPLEVLRLAKKEVQSWELAQIELHTENHGPLDLEARRVNIKTDTLVRKIYTEPHYIIYVNS